MDSRNKDHKALIFIVSYNAENHIDKVLQRLVDCADGLAQYDIEVLLIDDASNDNTMLVAEEFKAKSPLNLTILKNPVNQGYGGNQKIGYQYALKFGFDSVVLLHGDNQYPPESIKDILGKIVNENADVVLGSRMLEGGNALKGGMPYYKFIGNKIITKIQNRLLHTNLSEFHTGFKGYSTAFLKRIPFAYNSNDFDFDTDIIIQSVLSSAKIAEIPIPTHYGDEICNVNGKKYALQVLRSTFLARVQKYSIYYHPKFDFAPKQRYAPKVDFDSSHKFAIDNISLHSTVLDIGCDTGFVAEALKDNKKCTVYGVDKIKPERAEQIFERFTRIDIEKEDIAEAGIFADNIDNILLLDVIEHLENPERFLAKLRNELGGSNTKIIITSGNIGFFLTRLSLLVGNFNYSKRGTLDIVKKKFFTFHSLKRMLRLQGYSIEKTVGIPVPAPFIFKNRKTAERYLKLNRFFIRISRSLFSYQIGMVVRPLPTLDILLERAKQD